MYAGQLSLHALTVPIATTSIKKEPSQIFSNQKPHGNRKRKGWQWATDNAALDKEWDYKRRRTSDKNTGSHIYETEIATSDLEISEKSNNMR